MDLGAGQLAGVLGPWRQMGAPLSTALADAVQAAVLDGRIRPRSKLPAERRMAAVLGVSRGTVTAALDRLRAAGWVETRHGSASTVRLPATFAERIAPVTATGETGGVLDLRRAVPAAPREAYLAAARRALEHATPLLAADGEPGPGLPRLRRLLADRYTRQGLATRPEQILVTSGSRAALALVSAHLRPRVAAVEAPTYFEALRLLRGSRARLVGFRVTTAGWDLDQLESAFAAARGHLAYLVPDFQNPTGALMTRGTRRLVAQLADRHQVALVVDETMRDLDLRTPASPPPRIRGAILIGSVSKTIWAGLQIGWIRAPSALVTELGSHPLAAPLSANPVQQLVTAELLADLDRLLDARRRELRHQRDRLSDLLAGSEHWTFSVPPGGLTLWLRLTSMPAKRVVQRAREGGIELTEGPRFAPDATLTHYLRVPYTPPPHVLDRIAAGLAEACGG